MSRERKRKAYSRATGNNYLCRFLRSNFFKLFLRFNCVTGSELCAKTVDKNYLEQLLHSVVWSPLVRSQRDCATNHCWTCVYEPTKSSTRVRVARKMVGQKRSWKKRSHVQPVVLIIVPKYIRNFQLRVVDLNPYWLTWFLWFCFTTPGLKTENKKLKSLLIFTCGAAKHGNLKTSFLFTTTEQLSSFKFLSTLDWW